MADITIDAVSASYSGTENADDFQNGTGNLRDITVAGLSGDDLLSFGSAVQAGTGDGGKGLGYSIGSSDLSMGAGEDTLTFSGQAGSGAAQFRSTTVKLGAGDDYTLINGLVSASGSTLRGNEGDDEIIFNNASGGGSTAHNVLINANAGDDSVNFAWSGTEANGLGILGGGGVDTISATFNAVSAWASAKATFSGAKVGGNKGDDSIVVNVIGTSDQVRINGNSGADSISVTAAADNTNFGIAGGKGDDLITAAFVNANSSDAATVAGSLGNDTVNVNFSGGHVSGLVINGASGADSLVLSNQVAALTAGSGNQMLGGTGADTITLNIGADLVVTGASGFVADLGIAVSSAVSGGGTQDEGGVIDVNLSASMTARTGAAAFFRGTSGADAINVSNVTGGGGMTNVTFSGEAGADTISFDSRSAGAYSATTFNAGGGNDLITAQLGAGTNFAVQTGGRVAFDGDAGNDTMVINIEQGEDLSAALFDGGAGDDSITLNLLSGGSASVVNSGTELVGGSGADTIGIAATIATTAELVIRAGSGADVISGTLASGGVTFGEFSAFGGDGADTIAFTFTAAATAGIAMQGASGGIFEGGAGNDSLTVIAAAVTGGSFSFGTLRGGAGADTITFGGEFGVSGGEILTAIGEVDGGAGADSLVFSGNNTYSGGQGFFIGGDADGSGGFHLASGDSLIGGYDTIFVANEDVTGGQTMQQGTFGSAGFNMSGFNAATFTMSVDRDFGSAGNGGVQATTNAIYVVSGGEAIGSVGIKTGGFVGGYSAGGQGSGGQLGTFVLSGGSTLTQIFSAVDAVTDARGTVSVFNVQNGSAGTVDGFMFIQGGIAADHVIKFAGNGLTAGQFGINDGYFSAGGAASLRAVRENSDGSGGQVFFGGDVGVG